MLKMKVSEIFEGIQGEGKYAGTPALFIRLSGCTRACDFCDSKYHEEGTEWDGEDVLRTIDNSELNVVVFTGGEPVLQEQAICEIMLARPGIEYHLETNGDILPQSPEFFRYICFSPKEKRVSDNVKAYAIQLDVYIEWDIKIVTDLELNKDLIENATMLMPLTYTDHDKEIAIKVWHYCLKNNIRYCARLQVDLFGEERGK